MHRQLLTRIQYLAELNKRLAAHPAYVTGMRFVVRDSDPEMALGFDWEPHSEEWERMNGGLAPPAPFPEIAAEVHSLYRCAELL
jgi:hypothetical protein